MATTTPQATTAESPSAAPTRRRGVSLASRLAATVLGVGFFSLVSATLVGISAGDTLGRTIVTDALQATQASASSDVAQQLNHYARLAGQLSASPQSAAAITEFSAALGELSSTTQAQLDTSRTLLLETYEERYLEPLRERGQDVAFRDILSQDPAALYLQINYALPEAPITDPIAVTNPGDGSAWTDVHVRVHPMYRDVVQQADLSDVYLVDAETERVVYSVAKGPALGTSLAVGPYSGSLIARAHGAAVDAEETVLTDLSYDRTVPGVPLGAAASAVRDDNGAVIGTVILTYDGLVYTERLTSLSAAATEDGAEGGDDEATNDLYLIGADGTTRSDPPTYLADPVGFVDASIAAGVLPEEDRALILSNGTTVLVQPGVDATVNSAAAGVTEAIEATSMTGERVVSAVEQVPAEPPQWYVVSEVATAAAESTVTLFRQILLVGAAVFVVALAFVAVAWANSFMRPVRVISDRLGQVALARAAADDPDPLRIPDYSPVEFHRLARSITDMGVSLRAQRRDLREARDERLGVLKRMLPASVAQRIARGDIETLDEVPSATIIVVVVHGLGALARADQGNERLLLDQLHAELDDIAFEHGIDRIKVVGDSYFAACGHDRPYIDHAPRAVAFARRVAETVRQIAQASHAPLDTAIGINTGPVTIGMSGGDRLVYDVWGPTVTTAYTLARSARAGEVVLTDATRARLPDEIDLAAWQAPSARPGDDADQQTGRLWLVAPPPNNPSRVESEAAR